MQQRSALKNETLNFVSQNFKTEETDDKKGYI